MKIILILTPLIITSFTNAQSLSLKNNNNLTADKIQFKTLFSAGIGLEYTETYKGWDNSLNYNIEFTPHLGKGFYIGVGINNHAFPQNKSNTATYLYIYFSKAFYLLRKLGIYPGLGGTLGVSSKGHPGCCVGGAYSTLSIIYDIIKYVGVGLNIQVFTDFDEVNIIPGFRLSARF